MKNKLRLILISVCLIGFIFPAVCQNDIRAFFDNLAEHKCTDSVNHKFNTSFKYSVLNQEKMRFEREIPDSIDFSGFYNSFSDRLIVMFYNIVNSESKKDFEETTRIEVNDSEVYANRIIEYFTNDKLFSSVYNIVLKSYENQEVNDSHVQISLDSVLSVSMSYFDITFYSKQRGFGFHSGCGQTPFRVNYANRYSLLISGFCEEAIKMSESPILTMDIMNKISDLIKTEEKDYTDIEKIKQKYTQILHEMIMNESNLSNVLISYYEKRKDIEPFQLIY